MHAGCRATSGGLAGAACGSAAAMPASSQARRRCRPAGAPLSRAPSRPTSPSCWPPIRPRSRCFAAGGRLGARPSDYRWGAADVRLELDGETLRRELGLPESPQMGEMLASFCAASETAS